MKPPPLFGRLAVLFVYLSSLLAIAPQAAAQPATRVPAVAPAAPLAPQAADPAPPQFLRDLPSLRGLISAGDGWTIGGGFLYWAQCPPVDSGGGYLRRWPLRGGRAVTLVNGKFCTNPNTWAADESGLYYADGTSILRRPASNPFTVETIAASAAPNSRIILNNGTTIWRDYIFWLANNTLYSAHKFTLRQLAAPEPLGANAHSLLFANNSYFYWFADGTLQRGAKACLGFGGGTCIKEAVAYENGDHVTDVSLRDISFGTSTFPLWTSGARIRGVTCQFSSTGYSCSPGTSYTSALNNTVGGLASDGAFLFWVENRADACGSLGCSYGNNGRLMKWSLSQSSFNPGPFNEPQQIACKQCYANYTISGSPGAVALSDGWVYFDTSNGLSRLRADAPPLSANLAADSMEVTQGIQNLNNDVPLVADKPTYVRLYGRKLNGPNTYSVGAVLYGTRTNGAPLPGSPLRPLNGGQDVATNNADPNRATTQGNWLFQLPESWVGLGTITLRPLIDPQQVWSDPDQNNNSLANRSFSFSRRAPICLVTIPVRTHAPAASNSDASLRRMAEVTRQMMPASDVWFFHQDDDVAQLEARFGIPPWKYEPYAVPEKKDAILRALWLREVLSDDPDSCDDVNAITHYVGLVHAATNTKGNLGYGNTPGSNLYVKLIDGATLNATPQFWQAQAFNTLAHELAHNYGRQHVNCGGPANSDGGYPYRDAMGTNCVLDDGLRAGAAIPAFQRYYGFDTQSQTPIDPGTTADYLSYRAPFWVSDYTWRGLFGRINTPPATSISMWQNKAAAAQTRAELAAAAGVVYVSGEVDLAANTGSLDYAWVYPADAISQGMRAKLLRSAAPQVGASAARATDSYTLRLLDAAGAVLDERAIVLQSNADGEGSQQAFVLTAPAPDGAVARLELLRDATVVAALQPGGDAPTVSMISPAGGETIDNALTLSWRADDPNPTDTLLFTVQYSPDNGQHWQTMLAGLPNLAAGDTVTLELDSLSGLPGSSTGGRIRVAASDGYNTTLATSQPFTVAPRAPEPRIDAPGTAAIPAGQPVIVRGGATDVQDGGLSGSALNWTLDGRAIGSGKEQVLHGLAPGSYTLALEATNAGGKTATVSSPITIAPLVIPQTSGFVLDGTCDDIGYSAAPEVPLAAYGDGTQAFARIVRDGDSLFVCFVGLNRSGGTSPGGLAGLRVDTNYSREATPQPGDYLFIMGEDGVIATYTGTGTGYVSEASTGVSGQVSANASSWMAELRVDASVLGGWNHMIGLDVEHAWVNAVGDDYFWPHQAAWNNPSSWAAAALGDLAQISDLVPASVAVGAGDTTVTINGSGFGAGAEVQFNGVALATTVISSTQLQAVVPAVNLAVAGLFDVSIANAGLAAAPSNTLLFGVTNPVPDISQARLMGNTLTITGSDFAPGATVQFNGSDYSATGSSTQLTATVSDAGLVGSAGTSVSVFNPGPGGGVSNVVLLGARPGASGAVYVPLVAQR